MGMCMQRRDKRETAVSPVRVSGISTRMSMFSPRNTEAIHSPCVTRPNVVPSRPQRVDEACAREGVNSRPSGSSIVLTSCRTLGGIKTNIKGLRLELEPRRCAGVLFVGPLSPRWLRLPSTRDFSHCPLSRRDLRVEMPVYTPSFSASLSRT